MVILGVTPNAGPIDVAAPAIDMSAIRRDRDWLEGFLIRKTENERAMIKLADSAAIDTGLSKGTELWMALTAAEELFKEAGETSSQIRTSHDASLRKLCRRRTSTM
jgi:hypothetical protein